MLPPSNKFNISFKSAARLIIFTYEHSAIYKNIQ